MIFDGNHEIDNHNPLANFQPPRAGTMPDRREIHTIGIDRQQLTYARATAEAPGHLTGERYKQDRAASRERGSMASGAAIRRKKALGAA